jgi:heme-degrading monooxygenase HmoA
MILQFVKLKSNLPEKELLDRAKERQPQFEAIPGLIQKYYVKLNEEGYYGGIYVWDNKASLMDFKESDLAKSIPNAYEVVEAPSIDVMDIMFQLRND